MFQIIITFMIAILELIDIDANDVIIQKIPKAPNGKLKKHRGIYKFKKLTVCHLFSLSDHYKLRIV